MNSTRSGIIDGAYHAACQKRQELYERLEAARRHPHTDEADIRVWEREIEHLLRPLPEPIFECRFLERVPLGTPYAAVARRVRTLINTPPLRGNAELAVDATGVGAAVVVALADDPVGSEAAGTEDSVLQTGSGDDYINAVGDPAVPDEVRKDVIICGEGSDTVRADPVDDVAADCENVERSNDPEPDVQTAAFHCSINAQRPHKATDNGQEVMVAKGRLECRTGRNNLYLGTDLSKYRFFGWIPLDSVSNNRGNPRPAANTNLRWKCQSEDDFWFKNVTHGVVRYGGNQQEYIDTKLSLRKWRC